MGVEIVLALQRRKVNYRC